MPGQTGVFVSLCFYFFTNLTLSICNKLALQKFPFPWLVTTLHATFTSIGCLVLLSKRTFELTTLTARQHATIVLFSALFTINIAVSNISLWAVSLPFHQTARSTTPLFVTVLQWLCYSQATTGHISLSLVLMSIGITMATYGDYYCTPIGFYLTMTGVILSAIKTVTTNALITGPLKLHPLEILLRLSPLAACQSFILACVQGEVGLLLREGVMDTTVVSRGLMGLLVFNGLLAFFQNISSFYTNKTTGPLTISVCGNVKQCATILLGIVTFRTQIGILNGMGIMLVSSSSAWYSWIKLQHKARNVVARELPS